MDKGMGRSVAGATTNPVAAAASAARFSNQPQSPEEFEGIVRNGKVELISGKLPDGTRVQLRVKK